MESQTERNDARKPYETPAVRELGQVAEVTFGIGLFSSNDNALISAPI